MGGSKEGDDLFGVDDSDEPAVVIDDREGAEIVFVEELGHFAAVGVDVATDDVALRQGGYWRGGVCQQKLHDRNKRGDSSLFVEQVDVGDGFDVSLEVPERVDGLIDNP